MEVKKISKLFLKNLTWESEKKKKNTNKNQNKQKNTTKHTHTKKPLKALIIKNMKIQKQLGCQKI